MKLLPMPIALLLALYATPLIPAADDEEQPDQQSGTLFIMPNKIRYAGRHNRPYEPGEVLVYIGAQYLKESSDNDNPPCFDFFCNFIPLELIRGKKDGDTISIIIDGKNTTLKCSKNLMSHPIETFTARLQRYIAQFEREPNCYKADRKFLIANRVLARGGWWDPRICHGPNGFRSHSLSGKQESRSKKLLHSKQ